MGVYVYTLRAETKPVRLPSGEVVDAALLRYSHKPFGQFAACVPRGALAAQKRQRSAAAAVWNDRETPAHVVIGDGFAEGCEVRSGWPKGRTSCMDEPSFPGEAIGRLHKADRRWIVRAF